MRIRQQLWILTYWLLFRPSPKPLAGWRRALLRLFGAQMSPTAFVASGARINRPWNLRMDSGASLASGAEAYALGSIHLGPRCTIAQEAFLCTGTHDLEDPKAPLVVGHIEVGPDVFVGARAIILPGVHLSEGCVVGAGSVVPRDVSPWTVVVGNPARAVRERRWRDEPDEAGP